MPKGHSRFLDSDLARYRCLAERWDCRDLLYRLQGIHYF
jgi:hypothetical protein